MTSELRAQVLDASVQLIAEVGLGGLSMREVARRAGVSHQAPYHYFPDKESIIAALVTRGFMQLAERLEACERSRGTVQTRLSRAGRDYVDFALAQPVYFRLMFRPELVDLSRFPDAQQAGARALSALRHLVDEVLGPRASAAKREAMVSLHWSVAHGLAALLVDGSLGHSLREPAERSRHIEQVLALFSSNAGSP